MIAYGLSKDGDGPGDWRVWAVHEDGTRVLLTEVRTWDVKEPRVIDVERIDKQTKKPRKEKRHVDVVVGTRQVCGEGQTSALAKVMEALKKEILKANHQPTVLNPGEPVQTKRKTEEEHDRWTGVGR